MKRGKPIGANTDATNRAKQAVIKLLTARKRAGDDSAITNAQVKELVSTSGNTVSRALNELKAQGLIEEINYHEWKLKEQQ